MYVIKISKHSPEACPAFVEKFKDTFLNAMEKDEALAKKHDIKIIGAWVMDRRRPEFYNKFIKRNIKLPDHYFE